MASYTPNLNLIKPADADSYDVANDNGNMDKIDAAYAKLTFSTDIGTFATLSALSSALDTLLASMGANENRVILFRFSATVDPFANTVVYSGMLYKSGSSTDYSHMMVYPNSNVKPISGTRLLNVGWSFDFLANETQLNEKTYIGYPYTETASYQMTLPSTPYNGVSYLVTFKHFTSASSANVDMYILSFTGATSSFLSEIAKHSDVQITNVSISGRNVTFTFNKKAYCSVYIIKTTG